MNISPSAILIGFVLAGLIATAAWRVRALSISGALAAAGLGTIVFGLGGWGWAVLMVGFFVTSSMWSRLFGRRKLRLEEKYSKGSRRDAAQVLANGGLAGLAVVAHAIWPGATWPWLAFAGALAAANADTWATELGVLSPTAPILITTLRPVERGASGGVSVVGTLAALAGAGFIAGLAALFQPGWSGVLAIALGGLAGSLLDSVLGARLQAIYTCPVCHKETERHPLHTCGAQTHLIRGLPWLDNEWVNLACTLLGAALALGLG